MKLRRPTFPELILQFLCVVLLVLVMIDYFDALNATSCSSEPLTANCYPWGAEGPVAERWAYSSKEAYLRSSLWRVALLGLALLPPLFIARRSIGAALIILLASSGIWMNEMLARIF